MATPEQTMLATVLAEYAANEYPGMSKDEVFERFAVSQLRRPHELSGDDLESGIVDGARDGGVDAVHVFVNGALLGSDHPFLNPASEAHRTLARNPRLEILIAQAKNQDSWKEAAWEKLLSTLANVLDPLKTDVELERLYNSAVVESTGVIRRALQVLPGKFPKISIKVAYVTKASENNLSDPIKVKASQVKSLLASSLPADAEILVETLGAEGLYALAARPLGEPATLAFRELVREPSSYLGVVSIEDYLRFIRDPATGSIREELFDANVRDFEGDNRVNSAISATLSQSAGGEFWWLNNGVTVLGDEVAGAQKSLTISRPLIVNGLQTSHVLHRTSIEGTLDGSRLANGVVVRVIESTDEVVRDRIIEGTNRQTPVPGAALFATDAAQVRLEAYLKTQGFYYERRKNRYKNLGVPAQSRVSMSLLSQSMITVLLGEPDQARARPSSILTRTGGYESVFPADLSMDAYVRALELLRDVNEFLKSDAAKSILDEPSNTRFYVLAGSVLIRGRARSFSTLNFDKTHSQFVGPTSADDLEEALRVLARVAKRFQGRHLEMSRDSVFKNADFRERYLASIGRVVARQAPAKKAKKAATRKA